MESDWNPKLSAPMSKEPDLEDFTTMSLLVVSIFSNSRWIGVDLMIIVRFKKLWRPIWGFSNTRLMTTKKAILKIVSFRFFWWWWCCSTCRRQLGGKMAPLQTLSADLTTFRWSFDDGPEGKLVGRIFLILMVWEVTAHSPCPAATVLAVAAPAMRQLHSCCSELLELCATESSTLDPIHPKPWNLCYDTSC